MSILESEIEGKCRDYAKKYGYFLLKIQNAKGWPDRLLLSHNGEVIWMEFKRPLGKIAPLQAFYHQQLRSRKFQVEVVYSLDQFKQILVDLARNRGSHTTTSSEQSSG